MEKVRRYEQAIDVINKIGFMPLSKNPFGYISLEGITDFSCWHTGSDNDPWIWKDKIALEKKAAYTKLFSYKPMFISWEWYSIFMSFFRPKENPDELYEKGELSLYAKQIYNLLKGTGSLNTHEIKCLLNAQHEKTKFENALNELQARMFITVCGASQKKNKEGIPYGWFITKYALVEEWIDEIYYSSPNMIPADEAENRIKGHICRLIPDMTDKNIKRFIGVKI